MDERPVGLRHSIRTKIVLVAVLVEVAMLALLLMNSLRLLNNTLEEQTHLRLEAVSPLLNAALAAPLFERDHVTIREILDRLIASAGRDFRYIAVLDERGLPYAAVGAVDPLRLPRLDLRVRDSLDDLCFDAATPLTLGPQRLGEVRFGLSLATLVAARDRIIGQGVGIAAAEVLLSFLLLGVAAALVTRHILALVAASQRVAAGDYSRPIPVRGHDEIARLAHHFNLMSRAIDERITALHRSERALAEEKERAEVTLLAIGDGVLTLDTDGIVRGINPAAERLTGWTSAEACGRHVTEVYRVVHETTRTAIANAALTALRERRIVRGGDLSLLLDRAGHEHAIEETASPILGRDGAPIGAVVVVRDVGEARELARRLEHQAIHDSLTGLINRGEFERRVAAALADARQGRGPHVMCYLDLDQFKVVNDTCGHAAGDDLLRRLAVLLQGRIDAHDVLARLGGDEFGLLLPRRTLEEAQRTGERLRDAIRALRFEAAGRTFEIGVSIGVVPITADSRDVSEVFAAADLACYIAKDRGRNQIHIHLPEDLEHERRRAEMHWSTRIAAAVKDGRLALYWQRIVPIAAGGRPQLDFELLVRLVDEHGARIAPGRFLPAAERYQQMPDIDRWVVREALQRLADPADERLRGGFSINLSGQTLGDAEFLEFVRGQIAATGIDPQRLCFEITETAAIRNLARASQFMTELRRIGCRFALDDFGSGLSSFAYLKALPVDFLKIDGSFVRNMARDAGDRALVAAIHQIARVMGLHTVAEFIEDQATLAILRDLGIHYGQGYALHQPEELVAAVAVHAGARGERL